MVYCDVNVFLSPQGGGIRTYHMRKAQWFARACPEDRYVTIQPSALDAIEPGPGENVEHHLIPGTLFGSNYRIFLNYFPVYRRMREIGADVLEAGDPYLTAKAGLSAPARLRTSFWHSDPQTAYFDLWANQPEFTAAGRAIRRGITSFAASWILAQQRRYDLVWCASEWAAQGLRRRGLENVEVLPFGTDKTHFRLLPKDRDWLRSLGLDPDRPVILYAGRLDREKGIGTLMRGMEDLLRLPSRPQLLVCGRGYHSEWFEAWQHPDYRYLGFLDSVEAMSRLYASADLLVATCAVETFGLAVLEALTSGLPVLSADNGGGAEVVRKSAAGATFKAGDTADLVRQAGQILPAVASLREKAAAFGAAWPSWDDFFAGQHARNAQLLKVCP
ncbi:MAG: hypothetical protein RL318_1775 [Fibrobacterota bacterium]|jgi:alpha-1,6-mannosyltransferase